MASNDFKGTLRKCYWFSCSDAMNKRWSHYLYLRQKSLIWWLQTPLYTVTLIILRWWYHQLVTFTVSPNLPGWSPPTPPIMKPVVVNFMCQSEGQMDAQRAHKAPFLHFWVCLWGYPRRFFLFFFSFFFLISWRLITLQYCSAQKIFESVDWVEKIHPHQCERA